MLNSQSVAGYILPPPVFALREAPTSGNRSTGERLGRLADRAAAGATVRAALKEQHDRFEELYRQAEQPGTTPEELEATASIILDMEGQAAAALRPQIEQLEQTLLRKRPATDFVRSLRRATEEALDIARTWLELYQNLRILLLKLASDRRVAAGETGSPVLSDASEMDRYLRRIADG